MVGVGPGAFLFDLIQMIVNDNPAGSVGLKQYP
jgi:hypothetical protein